MALRSTQPVTEIRTRNSSWGQRQPVLRVDNRTTFMWRIYTNTEASVSWNYQDLSKPEQGLLFLYLLLGPISL